MWQHWTFTVIFLKLLLFGLALGQTWDMPYFEDPQTDGITYTDATGPNNHHQRMDVQEELPFPFVVAIFNYAGETSPTIHSYVAGHPDDLQPVLERRSTDNKWQLSVNGRLDYENPPSRSFSFTIRIDGLDITPLPRLTITLLNIFDTKPTFSADGPCMVDELMEPHLTDCLYTLRDADGLDGNEHTFTIVGSNNENELFTFDGRTVIDLSTAQYRLYVRDKLDYERRQLYSFTVEATDVGGNKGEARITVEVDDVPNLPPKWTQPFVSARFDEKTDQTFQVAAIDGDTKINKAINFELRFESEEEWTEHITIGTSTGQLQIRALDRDALKQELFNFYIRAYKYDNISWYIESQSLSIILNDVNDNYPEIDLHPATIEMWEATFETLSFDRFLINDIDLGAHATYSVELISVAGDDSNAYSSAFTIVPNTGYQESKITVSVANAGLLDYEEPDWRQFRIKVKATEEIDETRFREEEIEIKLRNWNDEAPIFEESSYEVSIKETVAIDEVIGQVLATDRDVDDEVEYLIVGFMADQLSISRDGELRSTVEELLDYEKQTKVVVQLEATDVLKTEKPGEVLHTTYAQFIINVEDVNDETPDLRMPRVSPKIEENSPAGTIITDGVEAKDPDTTATLELRILWDESYATKNGQSVEPDKYFECFVITADTTDRNNVKGTISINPDFGRDIDYEEYEVLYLTIQVVDTEQEVGIGEATAVITIQIEDLNDNAPEFVDGTAEVNRTVYEATLADTVIGSVTAIDRDGPLFNSVAYSIEETEDTPPGLVVIDAQSGVITATEDGKIDCDVPPIFYLTYTIRASDGELENEIKIGIYIIDTNNKVPEFGDFERVVSIYENQTEGDVMQIIATDKDRDEQYRLLEYQIDFTNNLPQQNLFAIGIDQGNLYVQLQNGVELDRDRGVTQHAITVVVKDNKGGIGNSERTTVTVKLLDINDNAPALPDPSQYRPQIAENIYDGLQEGIVLNMTESTLIATDIDEGVNAEVSFRIVSITPNDKNADPAPTLSTETIVIVSNREINEGLLQVKQSLRGCYGEWNVEVVAFDHGDEGYTGISLESTATYIFTIDPHNYDAPKITFPVQNTAIRLRYQRQAVNAQLYDFNDEPLKSFEAVDNDGGDFGRVTFTITGSPNDNDHNYFRFVRDGPKKQQLQIVQEIEDRQYIIDIQAADGGGKLETMTNLRIVFVNAEGNPVFEEPEWHVWIVENDETVKVTIPEAEDPRNVGIEDADELFPVFYHLETGTDLFVLDPVTRVLGLKRALDREDVAQHQVVVVASNSENGPNNVDEKARLTITVIVQDVNDNPPEFTEEKYGVGITTADSIGKILFTVLAIDPDLNDTVRYSLKEGSVVGSHASITQLGDTSFEVDGESGTVTLKFKPQAEHYGYVTFVLEAHDSLFTAEATARVYIINESNRVSFIFENKAEDVQNNSRFITQTLSSAYSYECYIDDIQPWTTNGEIQENLIEVRAHFVEDNIAIDGDMIRQRQNDFVFLVQLTAELSKEKLSLHDVVTDGLNGDGDAKKREDLLQTLLIVISVLLGTLCVVLIVAFVIRTKNLNRQLKAFGTTDFGSVSSNLNRRGAPLTNVFSVEGSNPVMHNSDSRKTAFDEDSIQSDETDFIGYEYDNDQPAFLKNGGVTIGGDDKRDSVNVAKIMDIRQNSKNPMANGHNMNADSDDRDSLTRF